ncbi:3170_t:CDS:1, partial [Paraglomus occultum]
MNIPKRKRMRSDATKLTFTDYEDIMQYRDMNPKPLENLRRKYHVSNSRLYQIWRGQESCRVEWNQPKSNSAFFSEPCIISSPYGSDTHSNTQTTLPPKNLNKKDVIHPKSTKLLIKKEATYDALQSEKHKFGDRTAAELRLFVPAPDNSAKEINHEELMAL